MGLPPCGGSGLKCDLEPIASHDGACLPPCGGSGLKSIDGKIFSPRYWSPSMRREWIEIPAVSDVTRIVAVSLHADGVD